MCFGTLQDSYKIAETSTVKPTRYHMIPKLPPKNMEKIDGVPIMVYGPALAPWRAAAREIYFIYKKDRKITKGDPTGGWARMVSLVESGFCKRVDIYGLSSVSSRCVVGKHISSCIARVQNLCLHVHLQFPYKEDIM